MEKKEKKTNYADPTAFMISLSLRYYTLYETLSLNSFKKPPHHFHHTLEQHAHSIKTAHHYYRLLLPLI